jgi:hypothetical protein
MSARIFSFRLETPPSTAPVTANASQPSPQFTQRPSNSGRKVSTKTRRKKPRSKGGLFSQAITAPVQFRITSKSKKKIKTTLHHVFSPLDKIHFPEGMDTIPETDESQEQASFLEPAGDPCSAVTPNSVGLIVLDESLDQQAQKKTPVSVRKHPLWFLKC